MRKTLHIMHIEDNPAHAMLLQRGLAQTWSSVRVSHALDGAKALDMIATMQVEDDLPDIILLDLQMPGLTGFDVLEEIKANRRLDIVPVVIVSTSNNPGDIEKAFMTGADDYFVKPQTYQELLERLTNVGLKFFRGEIGAEEPPEGFDDNNRLCG